MQENQAFWLLLALSALSALAYGAVGRHWPSALARAAVKTSFMAFLAIAFRDAPLPFVLALALSAAGDGALAFKGKLAFVIGLVCFLLAQLCYALVFFALWMISGDNAPLWPRYGAMLAIIIAIVAVFIALAPRLRWMILATAPYAASIAAMACAAAWLPWPFWPVMLGAALFIASDSVLAYETFALPEAAPARAWSEPLVWWTYVGAQCLIVYGVAANVRGP